MLAPLRFEHGPLNLIGLAAKRLDCVSNLFISQVRLLNLNDRHWSCSLALCMSRTVREPTIAPAMNPITNPTVPTKIELTYPATIPAINPARIARGIGLGVLLLAVWSVIR